MPDEDAEKAEKLAAAKKRFEQLKKEKEQGKKGGKAGTAKKKTTGDKKKKDDEGADTPDAEASTAADESNDAPETAKEGTTDSPSTQEADDTVDSSTPSGTRGSHGRAPSMSIQSKMRSESFRRGSLASPSVGKSPGATSPPADAHEAYLKQTSRLEELEKENKRLAIEAKDGEDRWRKLEAELDELREGRAELGGARQEMKARDEEVEKLKSELATLQRQNAHLQSQTSSRPRRGSAATPNDAPSADAANKIADLTAQVASKSSTIESLESDLSTAHSQISNLNSQLSEQASRITSLDSSRQDAESRATSATSELEALKSNLESARADAGSTADTAEQQRDEATTRAARLDAELGATKQSLTEATSRVATLDKKVETLTSLRREAEGRENLRARESERENRELRARVAALESRVRDDDEADADGLGELEDEAREKLRKRIRQLEDENFDLRREAWRERRRELQPGLPGAGGDGFEEVGLVANTASPTSARANQAHSSFSDVINSGISAFTGQTRHGHGRRRSSLSGQKAFSPSGDGSAPRKNSLSLLSEADEDDFDEDAFRMAQEEEAKRRIERVKEVKRGLENYKGWRVDFTEVRQVMGGLFEV